MKLSISDSIWSLMKPQFTPEEWGVLSAASEMLPLSAVRTIDTAKLAPALNSKLQLKSFEATYRRHSKF